jgi:hypothetical protein
MDLFLGTHGSAGNAQNPPNRLLDHHLFVGTYDAHNDPATVG